MSSRTAPAGGRPGGAVSTRPALLAATVLLALVAVVGLVLLASGPRSSDTAPPPPAAPFGMSHVHGLGIDEGELVAGTHYGSFRISADGDVTQVGPTQDLMGFTVVGPGHYLASGHPGAGQDAPSNLGLIESTDGGTTWEDVSLRGEADFHSLEARHGRVYGHSGGTLMTSDDKRRWDQRARLALADLAVSPEDPDTLLATTEQGLVMSADGGERFQLVDGAPSLVLVEWTGDGLIIGVDLQGGVHTSDDRGASWEQRGATRGQPAALTAEGEQVYVATGDGRIVESSDGGRTFTVRYQAT